MTETEKSKRRKKSKKSATLNSLARMVSRGFKEAQGDRNKRFTAVYKKFAEMDKRFDGVDARLDRIEKKILEDHEKRIARLERALSL